MSLSFRPRSTINLVLRSRSHRYFWCSHCRRTVPFAGPYTPSSAFCPRCQTQVHLELDVTRPGQLHVHSGRELWPSRLRPQRQIRWGFETETGPRGPRSWIVLTANPDPLRRLRPQDPREPEDTVDTAVETWARNHRSSSPTAAEIDGLSAETVTESHVRRESHCAVCREAFEIGSEVRVMPCGHFYHTGCIHPWLRMRSSCPVCRWELPVSGSGGGGGHGSGGGWSWRLLFTMWRPLGLFFQDNWRLIHGTAPREGGGSWFRLFWHIL